MMSNIRENDAIEIPDVEKTYREPQEARSRQQGGGGLFLALILITLGGVMLLSNLGVLTVNVASLLRFWPVLLILIGLNVLVGRRSGFGNIVIAVIGLALIGAVILLSSEAGVVENSPGFISAGALTTVEGEFSAPLNDVDALDVELNIDWMALDISAGADDSIDADYVAFDVAEPEFSYVPRGSQGELVVTQQGANIRVDNDTQRLNLSLPPNVPLDLSIEADRGEVILDLNELNIESLNIDAGAGQIEVILPSDGSIDSIEINADFGSVELRAVDGSDLVIESIDIGTSSGTIDLTLPSEGSVGDVTLSSDFGAISIDTAGDPQAVSVESLTVTASSGAIDVTLPGQGDYDADLHSDFGSVEVVIPVGLEARAELDTDLGGMEIRNDALTDQGDSTWETDNYGRADDQVNLTVSTDVGSITIR